MDNGLKIIVTIILILAILLFCFGGTYILFNSNAGHLDNYMYYDLSTYELTETFSANYRYTNIDDNVHFFIVRNYRRIHYPVSPIFEGISAPNYSTGSIIGEFILYNRTWDDSLFAQYVYSQPNHILKADNIYIAPRGLTDILIDTNLDTPSILEFRNELIKGNGVFNAIADSNGDVFSYHTTTWDIHYPFDFNSLGKALNMVTIISEYGKPVLTSNADLLGVIKYTFVDYPQYVHRLVDGYLSFFLGKIL